MCVFLTPVVVIVYYYLLFLSWVLRSALWSRRLIPSPPSPSLTLWTWIQCWTCWCLARASWTTPFPSSSPSTSSFCLSKVCVCVRAWSRFFKIKTYYPLQYCRGFRGFERFHGDGMADLPSGPGLLPDDVLWFRGSGDPHRPHLSPRILTHVYTHTHAP